MVSAVGGVSGAPSISAMKLEKLLQNDPRMKPVWRKLEKLALHEHWRNRLVTAIGGSVRRADMWEENRAAGYKRRFAGRRPAAAAKTQLAKKLSALANQVQREVNLWMRLPHQHLPVWHAQKAEFSSQPPDGTGREVNLLDPSYHRALYMVTLADWMREAARQATEMAKHIKTDRRLPARPTSANIRVTSFVRDLAEFFEQEFDCVPRGTIAKIASVALTSSVTAKDVVDALRT